MNKVKGKSDRFDATKQKTKQKIGLIEERAIEQQIIWKQVQASHISRDVALEDGMSFS